MNHMHITLSVYIHVFKLYLLSVEATESMQF